MSRRLILHAIGFGLLLVALNVVIPTDASLGTDDGAYGGQVHALRNGGWVLDRPVPVVPAGNEGWSNAAITDAGPLPYTANPAYPLGLAAVAALGGRAATLLADDATAAPSWSAAAMQAVPALGIVLAASAAWLLAARWRPSSGPLAFWLVACGPLLVTSTGLWAHTLAAAAAGYVVLWVVMVLQGRPVWWLVPAFGALVVLIALRTESVLWVGALAAAIVAVERSRRAVAVAGVGGTVGVAVWLANRAWGLSMRADRLPIVTDARADGGTDGWLASRFPAGWELLLTTVRPGAGPVVVLVATALVAGVAAVVRSAARRPGIGGESDRPSPAIGATLVVAAGLFALVVVLAPGQLVAGLVPAWPILFLLLALGSNRAVGASPPPDGDRTLGGVAEAPPGAGFLLGSAALFACLVLLTQYGNSGGLQWGGRYLALAYPATAAAAAVVGASWFRRHRWSMSLLLVAPTLVGLVASHRLHTTHHGVVAAITAEPSEVVVTDIRPLPRLAWTALPTAFYLAEADDVAELFDELDAAGVETVTVYGIGSVDVDGLAGYLLVGESGQVRRLAKP